MNSSRDHPAADMALAILLPRASLEHVRRLVPKHELRVANSWHHLDAVIDTEEVEAVVFDPTTNGQVITEAANVLGKHPSTLFFAYVRNTPQNLNAVFQLSKRGLRHVFVYCHSETDRCFVDAVKRARARQIAFHLLAEIDIQLATLPAPLVLAIADLFDRPHRYENVADLAREARMPVRHVYRHLSEAGLMTPKKLVVMAKVAHAYAHLRWCCHPVGIVSKVIGCSGTRVLGRQIATVFNCSPSQLRDGLYEDFLVRLIEWMNKPSGLTPKLSKLCVSLDERYTLESATVTSPPKHISRMAAEEDQRKRCRWKQTPVP